MRVEAMPPSWRTGTFGRAWTCNYAKVRLAHGVAEADDAVMGIWIAEAPWAHPVWHSYAIVLIHLRPLPDGRDTVLYRPDATHEFWVHALQPDRPRAPAVLGDGMPNLLNPPNFAAQLVESSDEAARTKIEAAVELILGGELNPDTDAQRQWEALFGNAMIKKGWRAT